MPEFVNPFSGVTPDRRLTMREITRALRLSIAAEEEAVHLYEAIADTTDNELVRTVLQDVANEEREHVGEFQRLLNMLLPDEQNWLNHGAQEVEELAEQLKVTGSARIGVNEDGSEPETSEIPTVGSLKRRENNGY